MSSPVEIESMNISFLDIFVLEVIVYQPCNVSSSKTANEKRAGWDLVVRRAERRGLGAVRRVAHEELREAVRARVRRVVRHLKKNATKRIWET